MSTGCKSSHNGFLDVSHSNGGLRISGWIGQLSCLTVSHWCPATKPNRLKYHESPVVAVFLLHGHVTVGHAGYFSASCTNNVDVLLSLNTATSRADQCTTRVTSLSHLCTAPTYLSSPQRKTGQQRVTTTCKPAAFWAPAALQQKVYHWKTKAIDQLYC